MLPGKKSCGGGRGLFRFALIMAEHIVPSVIPPLPNEDSKVPARTDGGTDGRVECGDRSAEGWTAMLTGRWWGRKRMTEEKGSCRKFCELFFLLLEAPQGHTLIQCLCVCAHHGLESWGHAGSSLCVLSLGGDFCLLLGCVASSRPQHRRCWTGSPRCVYTSFNKPHVRRRKRLAIPECVRCSAGLGPLYT